MNFLYIIHSQHAVRSEKGGGDDEVEWHVGCEVVGSADCSWGRAVMRMSLVMAGILCGRDTEHAYAQGRREDRLEVKRG